MKVVHRVGAARHMSAWPTVRLQDVAHIIMGQSPPGDTYNETGDGLPFFQGKAEFGEVSPTPKKWCDAPKKIAEAGDILISVRAPVGPTNLASTQCCIGRGLAAIRASEDQLDSNYLWYVLRRAEPRLAHLGQGSTFAAIGRAELASIDFPLPPLPEQRRIVDLLSRAEGIVRLRREAEKKAAELIPALFLDMFGAPATNPKGWPQSRFADVGTLDRGRSRHRPRDAKELYGGPYPFLQTGEVGNSGGLIRAFTSTYSEAGLAQSKLWPKGTLCITIAANIAKTGVLQFDACFPDSVVGFLPSERVRTDYVQEWLGFLQPTIEANAPQAAQKNINLEILRNLPIPLPPIELQEAFQLRCLDVVSIQSQQSGATAKAQATFDALLARVFNS
jgi:type I restriction enzyme S subunit